MISRQIILAETDAKAKDLICQNFERCAHAHTLSRKLWQKLSAATGRMIAIAPDWVHLEKLVAYTDGSVVPLGDAPYCKGDRPTERLVAFVEEHLRTGSDAVAVCENLTATRKTYENWQWGPTPPVACYGDEEVYHFLEPKHIGLEVVEDSIRQSHAHWGTGVCSRCEHVPEGEIPDEVFLDEIVRNTKHIFMPAFDNEGYLIWSPEAKD